MAVIAEKLAEADGLQVRYLEEGQGPPVILLHGAALGSSADVWERTMTPLAAHGLRVIAYDQPGFGTTELPRDYSVSYRRRFILHFMDALGLERAGLVGASQAGSMAALLAIEAPDRISRVLVLGTGSLLPPPSASVAGDITIRDAPEQMGDEPTVDDVRKILEEQLYNHSLITPALLQTRLRAASGSSFQALHTRLRLPRVNEGRPMAERLEEVPVPLLMVYGANDHGGTVPERVALARERYPHLRIHLLDRCKHLVQLDAADEFVRLAGPFFIEA